MAVEIVPVPEPSGPAAPPPAPSRRSLLAAGISGIAGLVLGAFGRPAEVDAAAGYPLIMGRTTNNAGTSNTTLTTASTGTALRVTQNGTGTAMSGVTGSGSGYGVLAQNTGAAGAAGAVRAAGGNNHGVVASTANRARAAIVASNTATSKGTGAAIQATGGPNYGVDATSTTNAAVRGVLTSVPGTYGLLGLMSPGGPVGVAGVSVAGTGVQGSSDSGAGLFGGSNSDVGVYGQSGGTAIYGTSPVCGVRGDLDSGETSGILGALTPGGPVGVAGATPDGVGVQGNSETGIGVYGGSNGTAGVYGWGGPYAVYGTSGDGYALYGDGDGAVTGAFSKASGTFKIDHPQDPARKYLQHSFVESPDMKNVYDGVADLDAAGEAVVRLPAYFEALNRDARVQLTSVGAFSPLYVKAEVAKGRFTIAGGRPGQRAYWQVTGIRRDPWAEAHPVVVELKKTGAERGTYLHPELYGQPSTKALAWAVRSKAAKLNAKR